MEEKLNGIPVISVVETELTLNIVIVQEILSIASVFVVEMVCSIHVVTVKT